MTPFFFERKASLVFFFSKLNKASKPKKKAKVLKKKKIKEYTFYVQTKKNAMSLEFHYRYFEFELEFSKKKIESRKIIIFIIYIF